MSSFVYAYARFTAWAFEKKEKKNVPIQGFYLLLVKLLNQNEKKNIKCRKLKLNYSWECSVCVFVLKELMWYNHGCSVANSLVR